MPFAGPWKIAVPWLLTFTVPLTGRWATNVAPGSTMDAAAYHQPEPSLGLRGRRPTPLNDSADVGEHTGGRCRVRQRLALLVGVGSVVAAFAGGGEWAVRREQDAHVVIGVVAPPHAHPSHRI